MKRFHRSLFALSFSLLAALPARAEEPSIARSDSRADAQQAETRKGPLTYVQLRNELMDFADRYMQIVGQACDTLQRKNANVDSRLGIHSMKLFSSSAAFTIAADSSPQMALLDMIVLVYLQGDVWKETAPTRFKENASYILNAQKMLEEDIDSIAKNALSAEQLSELKKLVVQWRKAHPEQRYVSYIRFADFASMRQPEEWQGRGGGNPFSIGGLLSAFQLVNVDEASRSVDQARATAERAIYLSQRMPTLLRWQTQMMMYEIASMPEMKSMLTTSETLRTLPERFTKGALIVALAAFLLALLYKVLSVRIK